MIITIKEFQTRVMAKATYQEGIAVPAITRREETGREWEVSIPEEIGKDVVWQIDNLITRLGMTLQDAASSFNRR